MKRNIIKDIKDNSKLSLLLLIAAIIVFFAAIYFVMNYFENQANTYTEVNGGGFSHKMPSVSYNGSNYRYKSRLKNILVMGVDTNGDISAHEGETYHGGQSDVMFLVSVDYNNKAVNYLQLNRDIMTSMNTYDSKGEISGKTTAQICLAYAYGDGKRLSCKNAAATVSNLLYGVPVDEYYSLNIDGIAIINDAVGGVPVKIEDDFTGYDDTLIMGETVMLHGVHATNFLRTRRGIGESKNVDRMRRHRAYLTSLKDIFTKKLSDNPKLAVTIDRDLETYRNSSMSANTLAGIFADTEDFTSNDIIVISGAEDYSGTYVEVTPNDEEIKEIVMDVFYEKAN